MAMSKSLQIKVPLSPTQVAPVSIWTKRLNESAVLRMDEVKVVGDDLCANAYDLSEVLRVANESESNEFDLFKLRAKAIRSIVDSIQRRRNPVTIRNLRNALADVERARIGALAGSELQMKNESKSDDFFEVVH